MKDQQVHGFDWLYGLVVLCLVFVGGCIKGCHYDDPLQKRQWGRPTSVSSKSTDKNTPRAISWELCDRAEKRVEEYTGVAIVPMVTQGNPPGELTVSMATDYVIQAQTLGKHIYVSPEYLKEASDKELESTLAHELVHVAANELMAQSFEDWEVKVHQHLQKEGWEATQEDAHALCALMYEAPAYSLEVNLGYRNPCEGWQDEEYIPLLTMMRVYDTVASVHKANAFKHWVDVMLRDPVAIVEAYAAIWRADHPE